MDSLYLWVKAFHVISVMAWMAGMLYLPRLFVYHVDVEIGSEMDKKFQMMEHRLLRYIINPAMLAAFFLGGWLIYIVGWDNLSGWFHLKALFLFGMVTIHGFLARYRKQFVRGTNTHNAKFYRIINEVPTVLMIVIVVLAVVKPF